MHALRRLDRTLRPLVERAGLMLVLGLLPRASIAAQTATDSLDVVLEMSKVWVAESSASESAFEVFCFSSGSGAWPKRFAPDLASHVPALESELTSASAVHLGRALDVPASSGCARTPGNVHAPLRDHAGRPAIDVWISGVHFPTPDVAMIEIGAWLWGDRSESLYCRFQRGSAWVLAEPCLKGGATIN